MKGIENRLPGRGGVAAALIVFLVTCLALIAAAQSGGKAIPSSELPSGSAELIQPEELLKTLSSRGAKSLVLYVGPRFLYAQAHIPGAEFIGPASDPQALDRLRKRAAALPKNARIVLYCGCCPWEHCPNIRPAFQELQKMGFRNVKALYLANSFGANWAEKGYPVEKGEAR
ncbi:MAG: rhodanese-like domain-containing protein [Acidobacteriia bacterium]|nr:rhodanese-like domain-containing protein [Terriglobia bacterium]